MKIQIYALIDKEATTVNNDTVWCICTDVASMEESKTSCADPVYAPFKPVKWVTCEVQLSDLEDASLTRSYPILTVL